MLSCCLGHEKRQCCQISISCSLGRAQASVSAHENDVAREPPAGHEVLQADDWADSIDLRALLYGIEPKAAALASNTLCSMLPCCALIHFWFGPMC